MPNDVLNMVTAFWLEYLPILIGDYPLEIACDYNCASHNCMAPHFNKQNKWEKSYWLLWIHMLQLKTVCHIYIWYCCQDYCTPFTLTINFL